ncbi:sigma-70 family RNA polymerase sigma factor [Evansella sp. AB-P1]|uniref:sigma-70 family RNA polymerase sigma factor n=1 Tax=Evansella sp. AB-P1 TaxID=3037653 RepID=UPI00241F341E|nr:sigma-70 family RNA polymerase sigma factor [Evansella sp. AB-P1]MDG5789349.1 sigma-70 family RNA polymerase sigma factor [Evansella sp. AB-P1]
MEQNWTKEATFEACCEKYMPIVFAAVKKWNLGREVDEYVQIGRIALYDAWCKYDLASGPFAPYAQSYIHGRIKRAIANQDKWSQHYQTTEPFILAELSPAAPFSEEELLLLKEWIKTTPLSKREKLWVEEGIFYGYKPQEIAKRHKVSITTVKSWRKQAIKKLRGDGSPDATVTW